jgi:hypothetical protein
MLVFLSFACVSFRWLDATLNGFLLCCNTHTLLPCLGLSVPLSPIEHTQLPPKRNNSPPVWYWQPLRMHTDVMSHLLSSCHHLLTMQGYCDLTYLKRSTQKFQCLRELKNKALAIQDLERALLTSPESSEVIRQHNRVQQELAEERRMQELSKVPSSSVNAHTDAKAKLEACRDIEGLSRTLANVVLPCTAAEKENQACKPTGIGPLPGRSTGGKHSPGAAIAAFTKAAKEAKTKIAVADDMKAYFRSCGGLASAMNQLLAAAQASEEHSTVLTSCSELINEACQIDTNARYVAGCAVCKTASTVKSTAALLAALCSLCSKHYEVAVLLHTLSTETEARLEIAAAFTGCSGVAVVEALRSLPSITATHRAILLSLLSACATAKSFQAVLSVAMRSEHCETILLDVLKTETNPMALEQVAALVTNAALSAAIRRSLGSQGVVGKLLVARTSEMLSQKQFEAALSCLKCMFNLVLEDQVRTELVCQQWLAVLKQVIGDEDSISELNEMGLCALSVTARAASATGMHDLLQAGGVVPRIAMLAVNARALLEQQPAGQGTSHKALKVLDASVRALTTWACSGHTEELRSKAMLQLLIWTCSEPSIRDGCAGNAALCLSYLADERCFTGSPISFNALQVVRHHFRLLQPLTSHTLLLTKIIVLP